MWEYIKSMIENKKTTINEVAKNLNITPQVIYAWRDGKAKPKVENLEKLATYFNVPITYFFTGNIIEKQQDNFSNEDLLLAREINKTDKIDLIKDIIRIQKESDVALLKEMTNIFLSRK